MVLPLWPCRGVQFCTAQARIERLLRLSDCAVQGTVRRMTCFHLRSWALPTACCPPFFAAHQYQPHRSNYLGCRDGQRLMSPIQHHRRTTAHASLASGMLQGIKKALTLVRSHVSVRLSLVCWTGIQYRCLGSIRTTGQRWAKAPLTSQTTRLPGKRWRPWLTRRLRSWAGPSLTWRRSAPDPPHHHEEANMHAARARRGYTHVCGCVRARPARWR